MGAVATASGVTVLFAKLLAQPGVVEHMALGSRFGFLAFHGGALEKMTDVIAADAAERAGASLYTVALPAGLWWHIPSTEVRPEASPALAAFLDHVDVAVAVHGYGRDGLWTSLLAGGTNRALAAHLASHLEPCLPDHEVVTDIERIPVRLRGRHPRNPVNLPRDGGVQLELPPRVRGLSPKSLPDHTERLVTGLARAAAAWIGSAHGPADLRGGAAGRVL